MSKIAPRRPLLQLLQTSFRRKREKIDHTPIMKRHPLAFDRSGWWKYWETQGQPWRTEPEIDAKRQAYLTQRRDITPNIGQHVYPFKNISLSRADVEWLLATYENGRGPVDWSDGQQRDRKGLDLRGANLYRVNLNGLPLACMQGGLSMTDIYSQKDFDLSLPTDEQFDEAGVHLELARLTEAHLEGATFRGAQMKGALIEKACLEQAIIEYAHLEDADLRGAILNGARLREVHLERANLSDAYLEEAFLASAHLERAQLPGAHLKDANLYQAHLEGVDLRTAHLEKADLTEAHLEQAILIKANLSSALLTRAYLQGANLTHADLTMANLDEAHLEQSDLSSSQLGRASFPEAHLEGAFLHGAHAIEANFSQAHMEGAGIQSAHLERADLSRACLAGAALMGTHLEGADLRNTYLAGKKMDPDDLRRIRVWDRKGVLAWTFPEAQEPTDLRRVFFDVSTQLDDCVFGSPAGAALVGNIFWGEANLTVVNWSFVRVLGDERVAWRMLNSRKQNKRAGTLKSEELPLYEYQVYAQLLDAVRANRQMALALQNRGMNEEAARFAYRAQVFQRQVLRWQIAGRQMELPHDNSHQKVGFWRRVRTFGSYIFSLFLDNLAGYGYHPWKSIVAYLFIIFGFMGFYLLASHFGNPHLNWDEALVLSVSSFHGRGFFSQNITLGDVYARLAAVEAVVGLIIEVCFIATFTQRFFGK